MHWYLSILSFCLAWHYRLSICRGYICRDSAHNQTITMIKLRLGLHSRTTPHTSTVRASYGVSFMSYTKKNTAIYRERTVLWCHTLRRPWYVSSIWENVSDDTLSIGISPVGIDSATTRYTDYCVDYDYDYCYIYHLHRHRHYYKNYLLFGWHVYNSPSDPVIKTVRFSFHRNCVVWPSL